PDDGPDAGRRAQLTAELAAERSMLERAGREREERARRVERLHAAIARDEGLVPAVASVIEALDAAAEAISARRAGFEAAPVAGRQAGEHLAGELRACAQKEATLHTQLHAENEALTSLEVRAQRLRDQVADVEHELGELAGRLGLEAAPASEALSDEARDAL